MDNKTLKTPYIEFIGNSSEDVTGSIYLVRFLNYHILLDYGFIQTSDSKADYIYNSKRPKNIKPKKIDAIIVSHANHDHQGGIPKLYSEGCTAPIFTTKGSKSLLTIMWQDSVKIFNQEFEKSGRTPLYTQEDVDVALNHVIEIDFNEPYIFNEHIKIIYYHAQHIVKAAQICLELNDGIVTKRIGYTGDISSYDNRYWLLDRENLPNCDVLIGETTYAGTKRLHKERDRKTDCNKIDMAIKNAIEYKSKIVIPTFSLNRLQDLLAVLYEMYNGNPPIKILIDSPLGKTISDCWDSLIDKDEELWRNIKYNKNFYWIKEFADSVKFSRISEPMLILAGGGMLQGGRATYWVKELLSNSKNYVIFSGYATPESVAGQLKSGNIKEITIDHTKVQNKAKVISMNSFSSHCDAKELLDYYTTIQYNKICLIHGEQEAKIQFGKELKERLSKANRTSRVICIAKDSKIHF